VNPLLLSLIGLGVSAVVIKMIDGETGARKVDNSDAATKRKEFVNAAMGLLGVLYEWGGGHGPKSYGLDCSGLVIVAGKKAGISIEGTADMMFRKLPKVSAPKLGDLAFYGSGGKAQHVVIMTSWDGTTGGCVGANGGDQKVTTEAEAKARNAAVSFVEDFRTVRKDFLGFGSILS
jgi:hypothetical protein